MSKFNHYATDLQAAFLKFREEYADAVAAFETAKKKKETASRDAVSQARANAEFMAAQEEFKSAQSLLLDELNNKRAELRAALEKEVRDKNLASPDAVDNSGLELLKSGILSVDDFYSLAEKYDDNPTMLRFVAKFAKETADDMDSTQAKGRGALHYLVEVCEQGQGRTMRAWDDLSKIVDYCSGNAHDRPGSPSYVIAMGKWWEELAGEAVESF